MSPLLSQIAPQALVKIHRDENGLSLGLALGLPEYPAEQWNKFGATVAKAMSELFPGETATFCVLGRGLQPISDANLSWTFPEKSDDV